MPCASDSVGRAVGMTLATSAAPLNSERRDTSVSGTRAVVVAQQLIGASEHPRGDSRSTYNRSERFQRSLPPSHFFILSSRRPDKRSEMTLRCAWYVAGFVAGEIFFFTRAVRHYLRFDQLNRRIGAFCDPDLAPLIRAARSLLRAAACQLRSPSDGLRGAGAKYPMELWLRFPTSAKIAPCGSVHCRIHRLPKTSIGPLTILPPPAFTRRIASSMSSTLK